MDCSIVPTKYPDFFYISTTDFFYPLVDDPYIQGKIGCANVLSDLYSLGVPDCDTMLMILAASRDMDERERDIVTKLMMKGFIDLAHEAGTQVTGGQTVMNPWPIIGGVASAVCKEQDFIRPVNAQPGDIVILTKPLGTQVAVNFHQWEHLNNDHWKNVKDLISHEEVQEAFEIASASMMRLNRVGARLMQKYKAHAATDVTGFGILGHARNLAQNQTRSVHMEIHTLPIIGRTADLPYTSFFKLLDGFSAETSGGLMVCLPSLEAAEAFCQEIKEIEGRSAWIIGSIVAHDGSVSENSARIIDDPTLIKVTTDSF
eukprot:TRINITY_DN1470_c0_g2_i1.p1 TRINITY_DN1470_c0_g2~~TRINITY_DN1470_c0_g2_i1.p1  ORF type:complete len:316 (+),score=122.08 TRINITY_DN1470_c0_g2_i1:205-1152(+)